MLEEAIANDSRLKDVGVAPSGELPVSELFGLLQCPGCNRELDRLNFGGRSSISIDVCTIHGAWFDAGELAKVLEIVRYKNEHAGAMPTDDVSGLTAEQRREKVLQSMGISDPEYDKGRAAPVRARDGFSADRLAGRVAFVAGGYEGAAAYGVLKAVARGSEAAFGWAVKSASAASDAPIGDVSNVMPARLGYQLPDLRCLFCGAKHPESATQCGVCNTPIARVVCPACRSLIAAGEEKCRCGAPLMPAASREQMACPRCKSALDRIPLDANTVAHRCARCLGSFFDIHDWTVVMDGAVAGRPLPLENFAPILDRAHPAPFMDAGAACSRCRRAMERIAFAGRSRVVVDVCASHGMWLDAGELTALCSFMKGHR
jgi:Zn-finger nucleic acid-binding protein